MYLLNFNNKIQFKMQHKYNTPERNPLSGHLLNVQNINSGKKYNLSHQQSRGQNTIDYKSKTFQLMQILTEMEIKQKQSERTIFYLQRQLQMIHKQLQAFIEESGYSSLLQVKQQLLKMKEKQQNQYKSKNNLQATKEELHPSLFKEEKISMEYQKILKQYKQIITTQEEKMIKYQSKWKQRQTSLQSELSQHSRIIKILEQKNKQLLQKNQRQKSQKEQLKSQTAKKEEQLKNSKFEISKLTQRNKQIQKLNEDIRLLKESINKQKDQIKAAMQIKNKQNTKKLDQQNKQHKEDLQMIKKQFRELIVQKQNLQQKYEKLKKKYKQEIQHFQLIQKEVQEKLIEVEKEIMFYKQQKQMNLEQIKILKEEIMELKQNQHKNDEQFSFGGYFNAQTQTQDNPQFLENNENILNAECYEISIKSLIQQNNRLKRTLVLLDKTKKGQPIPPEAQLQLKLLKGLSQIANNSKQKNFSTNIDSIKQKLQVQIIDDQNQPSVNPLQSPTFRTPDSQSFTVNILSQLQNEQDQR